LDFSQVPRSPGVYQLRWGLEAPKPIPRAAAVDNDGILYIGKHESDLRSRIRGLHWDIIHYSQQVNSPTFNPTMIANNIYHSAGYTYVRYLFKNIFPPQDLSVRWATCPNPKSMERQLLNDYMIKYLSLPPLNTRLDRI